MACHDGPQGLFDLPPEILEMVLGSLCKHDLTVCVRVNKAWYEQLIDQIWHTVEIQNLFSFHYFNDAYCPGSANSPVSLARNVHRIRVLKVLYTRALDAFLLPEATKEAVQEDKEVNDDGQAQNVPKENALLIEKLFVHFGDDPPRPPPPDQVTDSFGRVVPRSRYSMPWSLYSTHSLPVQSSINLNPLLDVLARSTQLVKFTTAVLPLRRKGQFEDEARLWAALPASLEQLRVIDDMGKDYMPVIDSCIPWMTGEERDTLLDRVSRWPKPATSLENLRSLTVAGDGADIRILCEILMDRRPSLEDLSLVDIVFRHDLENNCLFRLISQGSPKGWKTVGLSGCIYGKIGSQVVDALLQHAATLENVRIVALNSTLSSGAIQKLLCSAPNLKRFDTIPSRGRESNPAMLSAGDIIRSSQGWVCSKLESFKCIIEGIPRPDLEKRTNNRSLYGDLHDPDVYSKAQSQEIQRKVLAQLAQLTQLREMTLGQDSVYSEDWDDEEYYDSDDDDDDDITCAIQRGVQYECLTMTLEDGLDQLKNLKSMRRMNLHRMQHGQEVEELKWMKENWPVYGKEQRDSFWADRGHWVHIGDLQYRSFDDVRHWESFDWW